MKYCNLCAATLTIEHHGAADIIRTGDCAVFAECQRCGHINRPVIEYEIIPRPAENNTKK